MIALDTSALFAILNAEEGYDILLEMIISEDKVLISAASVLELELAISRLRLKHAVPAIDDVIDDLGLEVVAFDRSQSRFAREAFLRFGKGRHPAGLNYGDCFSYALAKSLDVPLLFKGDDFSRTDILVAAPPTDLTPREGANP
jgi:ribonuclease VapC